MTLEVKKCRPVEFRVKQNFFVNVAGMRLLSQSKQIPVEGCQHSCLSIKYETSGDCDEIETQQLMIYKQALGARENHPEEFRNE